MFDVKQVPKRLLICARYFDDDEHVYVQAFAVSFPDEPPNLPSVTHLVEEKARPDVSLCR